MRRSPFIAGVALCACLGVVYEAQAMRFGLGIATDITPVAVDPVSGSPDAQFGLSLRPVIEIEPIPELSISAYSPFILLREGADSEDTEFAESVFALGVSGRLREFDPESQEETLWYLGARGGLSTVNGRAGPYGGLALGWALSWLSTGRGLFVEANAGYFDVPGNESGSVPSVSRWTFGLSVGMMFRLGGLTWDL